MKIRVIWPGKTRSPYFQQAIEDYAERIRKMVPLQITVVREEPVRDRKKKQRVRRESHSLAQKATAPHALWLDAGGRMMSSEELSKWLEKVQGDVDFIVGGVHGQEAPPGAMKLSLGKMTLPHELARVVILEQIYRALTILKGLPYHK